MLSHDVVLCSQLVADWCQATLLYPTNETPTQPCSAEGHAVTKLAVVEDPEGWHVAGLRSRLARNATELTQMFEAGCQARDHGLMDLGSVHDRAAAVFTIRLAQFNPAAEAEDEDTATVGQHASYFT